MSLLRGGLELQSRLARRKVGRLTWLLPRLFGAAKAGKARFSSFQQLFCVFGVHKYQLLGDLDLYL